MRQHALQTAMTLYESGTYTLEMTARQAGVEERRLRDCLARRGIDVSDSTVTFEDRQRVAAD
jgi:predicted HTH domain antitoxin